MSTQLSDDEIRQKAVQRVRAKKGFLTHLTVYLTVNAFLWIIWALTASGMFGMGVGMRSWPWPIFATVGWGIGLVIHGVSTFAFHGGWEDSEVEKEVARMKKTGGS